MPQLTLHEAFDLAVKHHKAGRLREAEDIYRQILRHRPDHAHATLFLGMITQQTGRLDEALMLFRRAVQLQPNDESALGNLANALKNKGQFEEAIKAFQKVTELRPDLPEPHFDLGNLFGIVGRIDQAASAFRSAITLRPNFAAASNNLAALLASNGDSEGAAQVYSQFITVAPDSFESHGNLGNIRRDQGRFEEAIAHHRKTVVLAADRPEVHINLGVSLAGNALFEEAIIAFRRAISIKSDIIECHVNLANALSAIGRLDEAEEACRAGVSIAPGFPGIYLALGNVLKDKGRLDEAMTAFRQAISLRPDYANAQSNLAYSMLFHPGYDATEIARENADWNRRCANPLKPNIKVHDINKDVNRQLRIGYVSANFRDHVVGLNLLPLFQHHDKRQFHITCYSQASRPDAITERFQKSADQWRTIGSSDAAAVRQIADDRVDILVDLTLHMAHNRLLLFARKPTPVQVTFAGYPGSTGLTAIDYRLSDPYLDPPGMDESIYSEKTIRLPHSFWCYEPLDGRSIPVNSLPALQAGYITFGCLNNFCKINETVLVVWARVLRKVEKSRLILLAGEGNHRQKLMDRLSREGIDPSRITFASPRPRLAYLELYHGIDVGLDSFPYNGHTTSLDSYWMGVPVVTLTGQTIVSRAGLSQLSNLGLTELIARTPEQFVQIAVELANDLPRLIQLRSTFRQRMQDSSLMDALAFTRGIEAAYRQMWRDWCGI